MDAEEIDAAAAAAELNILGGLASVTGLQSPAPTRPAGATANDASKDEASPTPSAPAAPSEWGSLAIAVLYMHVTAIAAVFTISAMVLLLFTVQPLLTAVALTAGAGAYRSNYRESRLRARLRQHQEQANLQKRCRSLIHKLRAEVATLEQLVESQVNSPLSHTFDAKRNILRADNSIILRTECTACSRRSARCRSSRASLPKGGRGGGEGGGSGGAGRQESWTENPENNDDSGDAASWRHECHLYYDSSKTNTSELKSSDLQPTAGQA